jgi:adenylate cyclase
MTKERAIRKLSAVLSADVKGYSRLMGQDEAGTVDRLKEYRTLMADLILMYRGRVVDPPGDNILAEFASIVDATECAVQVQEKLNDRNAELPDESKMEFRIGINLGDVIEDGERIYGDGINIAARIESLAEGGGICISGTSYDQVKNKLKLEFKNLGEHKVKNIAERVRVYRVQTKSEVSGKASGEKRKLRKWIALTAAISLVLTVGGVSYWYAYLHQPTKVEFAPEEKMAYRLPEKPSIAVLPFDNMSEDPNQEYLSDGITESIIAALSQIPKLFVIARNSTFTYKRKPILVQKVSKELGVQYVLEGSVQRSGDRLRITAQLIDANTGNHLWAERYDRDLEDLFNLQDDITRNVIMALQVELTDGIHAQKFKKGTDNLEAYLKLLEGYQYITRYNKNDNERARHLIEEAIAFDPIYSTAYAQLAWTIRNDVHFGWTKTRAKSLEKAADLAKKAISLDEKNGFAYLTLAAIYAESGKYEKAKVEGKKGLSIDPSNSILNAYYGNVEFQLGKFIESIVYLKKAIRIDPIPQGWYLWVLGISYYLTGQNEEAIAVFRKWVNREPENAEPYAMLGISFILFGKPEEAVTMLENALSLNPDSPGYYAGTLAVARVGTGQTPDETITMMQELLSHDPTNADYCRYLSALLTFEGRHKEALTMAKKAVSLNPKFIAEFYQYLGIPHFMMGELDEAIAAFRKSVDIWPDYLAGHIFLTASYSLADRMEDARTQASKALKINPRISLEDIAKNGFYNFKTADKERFIKALCVAGLKSEK